MAALSKTGEGKNFVLYKDPKGTTLIRLDKVRFSFCFVGTPAADEDDDGNPAPKWRCVFMLPKETHTEAKNAVKKIILDLMAANDVKVPQERWFLSDGDAKADEDAKNESMRGHWLVSASDPRIRPSARNARGELILDIPKIDEVFYSGMWGNAIVRPWYFDGKTKNSKKTFPKRISCGLTGVQFWKNDKPFGQGRIDDTDAWEVQDDEDDGMGAAASDDDGL